MRVMAKKKKARRSGGYTLAELAGLGVDVDALDLGDERPPAAPGARPGWVRAARKQVHHPGKMNRLERDYAEHLAGLRDLGVISDYAFEPLKIRLGADWTTSYTPDFLVILPDGVVELHEVKGFWRDDARVKIKAAAAMLPFAFVAVTREKGSWVPERIVPVDGR